MKILIISSYSVHLENFLKLLKLNVPENNCIIVSNNFIAKSYTFYHINFSIRNILSFINSILKLSRIIKYESPDIIHIHQANSVALLTQLSLFFSKYKPAKIILTTLGSDILILPKKNILTKLMVKYVLKKSTIITYDASIVKSEILSLLPRYDRDRLKFFFYGIELPKNVDLNIKENIIYSNRLHKKLYRIEKIIEAFNRFSKVNNDWKLVIAATGPETDNLVKLTNVLNLSDKVKFVGWLNKEENMNWYLKSKIFVSIPESDAGSISLAEALACGCFCVVSDIPAYREIICEENGIFVSDVNEDFFTTALISYKRHFNPQNTIKKARKYSIEEQSKILNSIYNE